MNFATAIWLNVILFGFGFGILYCAPPGAVTATAVRLGLQRGFRAVWSFELGTCIGDAVWAVIGLAGLTFLAEVVPLRVALGCVGVFLLGRLAWDSLHTAWTGHLAAAREAGARGRLFALGAGLSIANPFAVVFWLSVGSALTAAGLDAGSPAQVALFFAAFMVAMLVWATGFALLVSAGRRWVRPRLFRAISAVSGVALAGFAVYLGVQTAQLAMGG